MPVNEGLLPVAALQGFCQVSTWKYTLFGVGAVGLNVLRAVKLKLGDGLLVVLPARAVMVVAKGIACTWTSVSTVTVSLPLLGM